MKKQFFLAFAVGLAAVSCTKQAAVSDYSADMLPSPRTVVAEDGSFELKTALHVTVKDSSLLPAVGYLKTALRNVSPEISVGTDQPELALSLGFEGKPGAYRLNISQKMIEIDGADYEGVVNGISSLRQMLPPEAEGDKKLDGVRLQAVSISDAPQFGWRGIMIDASRHFWNTDEVKKILDLMASYKLNRFHWHLTDDQGWRIEIKRYPLLTEKGAWRPFDKNDRTCMQRAAEEDNTDFLIPTDKLRITEQGDTLYGGYYTQEEIKDVVAYAAERGIEVIPEIDMPGHSMAAIAQYPELVCSGLVGWGKFFSSPLCPGKETTLEFCKNVYREVFSLFPSQYIHLGADEVDKSNWAKCSDCRRKAKSEKLGGTEQLQAWFVREMEQFFTENGRRLVGWDEVVEDGLSQNALITWWRSWEKNAPLKAVSRQMEVIDCPNNIFYLDNDEDKNSVAQILTFDAFGGLPDDCKSLVKGIQANVWAERIPSFQRLEYMLFPRLMLVGELAWGAQSYTDGDEVYRKLPSQFERLNARKVNYRVPDLTGFYSRNAFVDTDSLRIVSRVPDITVRYTVDGSLPDENSPLYTQPVPVKETTHFRLRMYRPDGSSDRITEASFVKESYGSEKGDGLQLETGLTAAWYDYAGESCTEITQAPFKGNYPTARVEIPQGVSGNIGLVVTGYLEVPADSVYTFGIFSDDGSVVRIDDTEVLPNDGPHSPKEYIGQKALGAGLHPIEVKYFDHNGGCLDFYLIDRDGKRQEIPQEWFKRIRK